MLGLAGRSLSPQTAEESEAGPARLPDLTESGSGDSSLELRGRETQRAGWALVKVS